MSAQDSAQQGKQSQSEQPSWDVPTPFQASVEVLDGVSLVAVSGELGLSTASSFDSAITAAIAAGLPAVVVDLCGASLVDSIGIGVLLRGFHALRQEDRRLLIACSGAAWRAFEATGLAPRLDLYRTRNAALAALQI